MKGEKYKSSEKIGVKYIQTWEEKSIERNEAREEGRAAGLKEGSPRKNGRAITAYYNARQGFAEIPRFCNIPLSRLRSSALKFIFYSSYPLGF